MIRQLINSSLYSVAQTAKMGWYTAHYVAGRHAVGPVTVPGNIPPPFAAPSVHDRDVRAAFLDLFRAEARDLANGRYRLPAEFAKAPRPVRALRQFRQYVQEADAISRRAHRPRGGVEVRAETTDSLPGYYRQNFHFQTDGWLSEHSASIYDTQVEALFTGAAAAMRRRALPFLGAEIAERAARGQVTRLLDIGCGTGVVLEDVMHNWPDTELLAIDLSAPYLEVARQRLKRFANARFSIAMAEALPLPASSLDVVMSVYLFHELPPRVRHDVAAEIARVLRPGGLYVHVDTVQYGDTPLDRLLEAFPRAVHEPFYDSYCREDLTTLFGQAGLERADVALGFLSKVTTFRRQEAAVQ